MTSSAELMPCGRFEWERILRRIRTLPWTIKSYGFLLASYADPDGTRIFPGNKTLAEITGHSLRTVARCLAYLRTKLGLLQVVRRGGGRGRGRRATEYRLTIPTDLLERVELLDPAERDTEPAPETDATPGTDTENTGHAPADTGSELSTTGAAWVAPVVDPAPVDNSGTDATALASEANPCPVDSETGDTGVASTAELVPPGCRARSDQPTQETTRLWSPLGDQETAHAHAYARENDPLPVAAVLPPPRPPADDTTPQHPPPQETPVPETAPDHPCVRTVAYRLDVTRPEAAAIVDAFTRHHRPSDLAAALRTTDDAQLLAYLPLHRARPTPPPSRQGPPPLCGQCDGRPGEPPAYRLVWDDDGRASPCPRCHPKAVMRDAS
ncbi:helix-turn-helix domain-containing protein [Longimycelium tulufanense]|nr:helix-turn-helix domain-containing protein [Longimycelium tulufanense]